jgi:hypothetical protein
METLIIILLVISMLVVLAIMVMGLFALAKGGDFHKQHGNRLMQWRVNAQGVAIFLVLLLAFVRGV